MRAPFFLALGLAGNAVDAFAIADTPVTIPPHRLAILDRDAKSPFHSTISFLFQLLSQCACSFRRTASRRLQQERSTRETPYSIADARSGASGSLRAFADSKNSVLHRRNRRAPGVPESLRAQIDVWPRTLRRHRLRLNHPGFRIGHRLHWRDRNPSARRYNA